jgi:hypothetical protein
MVTIARKAIFREIPVARVSGRALIVGIHPNGYITVRLKGTRRTAEAPATWIYRHREGLARHLERLDRRRSRKEARIARQIEMAIQAREASR